MLVDFAPYFFRGKMAGCLTRLSSTGLANVTSGGGESPSFVVNPAHRVASNDDKPAARKNLYERSRKTLLERESWTRLVPYTRIRTAAPRDSRTHCCGEKFIEVNAELC